MPIEGPRLPRASLTRLLCPRSLAIVGASATPGSLSDSLLTNLERAGYAGEIHLINPKRSEIRGRACLPSIEALPQGVDCAVLAIPRVGVLEAAAACARRGVGALIIFAAGFAESGAQGRAEQEQLAAMAREHGMVIEGPNCLGMVNYPAGIPLTFVMTQTQPAPAGPQVAVVSQSGAMAAVLSLNLQHHGLPLSYSISTGNEAASGVEDYVEYLIDEDSTRVVAMIVEQFREPQRFLQLAQRARARGQFFVLLHPGRSSAARASAATHTGALAGDYETMRTLCTDAGVVVVESLELLADVTQILIRCPALPRGGAAVLAESGAFKALTLDLCEEVGLPLPAPAAATAEKLRAVLPEFIPPANPLDVTAHALVDPDLYRRTFPPILEDPGCGSLVLAIILTDEATTNLKFPPILDAIRSLRPQKPVLFAGLDEGAPRPTRWIEALWELGVPFFPTPERAFRALALVTALGGRTVRSAAAPAATISGLALPMVTLPEDRSKEVLARLGLRIPEGALARVCEEALEMAARLGYPVALKAQAAELTHKSDVGGVALPLRDADEVAAGWQRVVASVARARPGLALDGLLVERVAPRGVEMIVGARRDPEWGPVALVGLGGVFAEALREFRLLAPDAGVEEIVAELKRMKGARLLEGFRGSRPADLPAVAEAVQRLIGLLRAEPAIREVEINPLVVYPEGEGVLALDALIVTG